MSLEFLKGIRAWESARIESERDALMRRASGALLCES